MGFFGDLVGGILSLPGTIVGALNGSTATNNLTEQLSRDQMAWQSSEAAINRDFQERTQQQQNDWNEMMWNKTNEWNSPANQVNLMRQAGLNPAALLSGGSASVSGSASSPSASQGAAGAMPGSPSVPHFVNNDAIGGLVSIASVMKSLGEAKKLGAETNQIETLLSHQVQNYILKNKDLEWSNEIKQADAYVSRKIKDVRVQKAFQELVNLQQMALNTAADTDYKKAQAASERLGQLLTDENIKLTKQQVTELGIRNRNLQRVFDSQFETAKSEQTRNYAQASEAREQAKTISDLRGWQVGYQQAIGELAQVDSFVKRNTMWQQCESYLSELRAKEMLPEQVEQAIINAKKTNDWFVVNQLLGVVNTGVKAYGTVKGAKTGQQFVDAQDVRNDIQKEYNEYLKSKDWTPSWRRSNGVPY